MEWFAYVYYRRLFYGLSQCILYRRKFEFLCALCRILGGWRYSNERVLKPQWYWGGWAHEVGEWRIFSASIPKTTGTHTVTFYAANGYTGSEASCSFTYTYNAANTAPTVQFSTLPSSLSLTSGALYAVRATATDANHNLGGVWVEYTTNGGSTWTALAWDQATSPNGNGTSATTNNNSILAGAPGTQYQFRCGAWDTGSLNAVVQYSGVYTVAGGSGNSATGGNITTSGGYTIHTFTSNGTFTPNNTMNVEVLVVAGGGGGAGGSSVNGGGGGGAGGVVSNSSVSASATGHTIVVGSGGSAGTSGQGGNGGSSSALGLSATGGGGGGNYQQNGSTGGSGGGAGRDRGHHVGGGGGTPGQGNDGGGAGNGGWGSAGGGGGAAAAGQHGAIDSGTRSGNHGNGGNGISSSISGSLQYYGGGGGGTWQTGVNQPTGGLGGGGDAGNYGAGGQNGANGTGGGGAGGQAANGGSGGSGIVIIRYATSGSGPTITTQPQSQTVSVGGNATFTVVATGASGYQWRKNGTNISGATGSSYPVTNAQTSDGGSYSVLVSGTGGSVTSANANLTVTSGVSATGGSVTTNGGYTIHTFTSNGTFAVSGPGSVEVLLVAGGGGGGGGASINGGGGGGAGGVISTTHPATATNYPIVVGGGGSGGTNGQGVNGGNSTAFGHTAFGGGGGGSFHGPGLSGGSGGGGGRDEGYQAGGASGTTGQGSSGGGAGAGSWGSAGGGGGAGGAGYHGSTDSGNWTSPHSNGGVGVSSSISGTTQWYAGGGAGAWQTGSAQPVGGSGVGGNAGGNGAGGQNGVPNTGGGGAGGQFANGGSGGSGIVIIRYPTSSSGSTAPTIVSQPQTQSVAVNASVTFLVVANGNPSPSYQWRKDGANIVGATSPNLTLNNVQSNNAGTYSVVVTNAVSSVTSNDAILYVGLDPNANDDNDGLLNWQETLLGMDPSNADQGDSSNQTNLQILNPND